MISGDVRSADLLLDFLESHPRLTILTGAGCSTESGIPDYRSPGGVWSRHKPILYSSFVRSAETRRFYWARSFRGWPRFLEARPNGAHRALARLEAGGRVERLITQNVDRLHEEAGSRRVIQLHGENAFVICLSCGERTARAGVQERLAVLNAEWLETRELHQLRGDEADFAPDGDAAVSASVVDGFIVPECLRCGGVLKPDVVFFGESVPAAVVEAGMEAVDRGDALLVAGSSLTVWSGFRFVKRAADRGLPIAIVNVGPTRGDDLAALKIEARVGELLPAVTDLLLERIEDAGETVAPRPLA